MLELAVVKTTPKSNEASKPQGKMSDVDDRADDRQQAFQDAYDSSAKKPKNQSAGASESETAKAGGADEASNATDETKKNAEPDVAFVDSRENAPVSETDLRKTETGEDVGLGLGAKVKTGTAIEKTQEGAVSIGAAQPPKAQAGGIDALATGRSGQTSIAESAGQKLTRAQEPQSKFAPAAPVKSAAETAFLSNTTESTGKLKDTAVAKMIPPESQAISQLPSSEMKAATGSGSPEIAEVIASTHFNGIRKEQLAKAEERAPSRVGLHTESEQSQPAWRAASSVLETQSTGLLQPGPSSVGLKPKADALQITISEVETLGAFEARTTAQPSTVALQQAINRPDTPVMIARQMAEALQKLPDRPVEIALNPRELGRVLMSISAAEAGITVNVIAERPETLDLMRRNIDQLAREFQSIGYEDINFAFAEGEAQQNFAEDQDGAPEQHKTQLDLVSIEDDQPPQKETSTSSGIDIRI